MPIALCEVKIMAYRLHNNDALVAAARFIASAFNITTVSDSSPPIADKCLWELQRAARERGIIVTSDQRTGDLSFALVTALGNRLTIRLNFWSSEAPTMVTVATGNNSHTVVYSWNGKEMTAELKSQSPVWVRTLVDPEISLGSSWLRRIKAGCMQKASRIIGFQRT
jgi:hypothetical protein